MRRISLSLLLALTLLLPPVAAIAEAVIRVDDTVAGLGTSVELTGAAPSAAVNVHVVSQSGEDTMIPVTTDARGAAAVSIPEALTVEAGIYRVFGVLGQRKITEDATFEVLQDRVDQRSSTVTINQPLLQADGRAISIVTVTLRDSAGNPLSGRPVQLVGSRAEDRIMSLSASNETDRSGAVQFGVQTQSPGEITLRAMDILTGTMLNQTGRIAALGSPSVGGFAENANAGIWNPAALRAQVADSQPPSSTGKSYDVPARIVIKAPATGNVRDVIPAVTVAVVDANGNTVESFAGTLKIETPGDKGSTLPGLGLPPGQGEVVIAKKGLGKATLAWVVSFSKSGEQKIVVRDESGTLTGETTIAVTGSADIPEGRRIRMDSPKDGDTVATREILITGKDKNLALRNLEAYVGDASAPPESLVNDTPDATGDADADGNFAFTVKLPKSDGVILNVRDESGQYDSGLIHLTLDMQGPALDYTLNPPQPQEGEDVTLSVKSEPGLPEVLFRIREQNITLTEGEPGTYDVLFLAPGRGDLDFTLSGRDAAGNVTDVTGTLSITGPSLPQVQNVRAQSLAGGIQLTWDAIPDETITGYRIDTGNSPGRSDTTLDTPGPTGEAAVMGLKSGSEYFVTVRALRGQETGPKSTVIVARTLGMEVTVTPQDGSLLLQWTFPDTTPLASFLLEFGSMEGEYSEQRTLEGSMRVYTVKDLLTQPYLIRLTPVATTGQILSDLTVTTQGTPTRALAFRASADELTGRVKPGDVAPENALHAGAPATTRSGLPGISLRLVLGLTAAALGMYWYRRRKMMRETRAFLAVMHRKYHS